MLIFLIIELLQMFSRYLNMMNQITPRSEFNFVIKIGITYQNKTDRINLICSSDRASVMEMGKGTQLCHNSVFQIFLPFKESRGENVSNI